MYIHGIYMVYTDDLMKVHGGCWLIFGIYLCTYCLYINAIYKYMSCIYMVYTWYILMT